MEFSLTAEQQTLVDSARQYARDALAPGYQEREKAGRIEEEVRLEMGAKGFIAPEISKELGGQGVSRLTSGMLLEQISTGDFNVGYLQVVGSLVGQILAGNARPEVAAQWVPQITSGEGIVGIGLSEPHAGSDAGQPPPASRAGRPERGRLGAHRRQVHVPARPDANGAVVFARTSDEGRGRGITAFVVDLNQPGVTKEPYSDMGTKAVARGAAHFDHVRVPAENVLGEVGQGFSQVMQGFDFSRALIGLQCMGTAQQTVDETWEYVSQREAFDRPISKNQGVSFPLAEAETAAHRSPFAVLPDAVAQGRRPAAHHRGGDVQVVGPEDRLRRDQHTACCCTASTGTAPRSRSSSACGTCSACRSATAPRRS